MEPVHGLHALVGQFVAAVGEHPKRLEPTVSSGDPQTRGADRDDRDRVRIQRIGLAVMAGVEEPHPRGQLRRNIEDLFAGLDQALRQRTTGTVGALDRPDPMRPLPHIPPQRGIPSLVGGEPARREQPLSRVDDLDRGRKLEGSTPMITPFICNTSCRRNR